MKILNISNKFSPLAFKLIGERKLLERSLLVLPPLVKNALLETRLRRGLLLTPQEYFPKNIGNSDPGVKFNFEWASNKFRISDYCRLDIEDDIRMYFSFVHAVSGVVVGLSEKRNVLCWFESDLLDSSSEYPASFMGFVSLAWEDCHSACVPPDHKNVVSIRTEICLS